MPESSVSFTPPRPWAVKMDDRGWDMDLTLISARSVSTAGSGFISLLSSHGQVWAEAIILLISSQMKKK